VSTTIAGVVATVLAFALWRPLKVCFAVPALQRENYRGHHLPTATGVVAVFAGLAVVAVRLAVEANAVDAGTLVVLAGFGFLGLFDDLAGHGHARGFRGHLRALGRGEITSGSIKLAGGVIVALAASALVTDGSIGRLALGTVTVALAANTANLLDRAPGRTIKVALLAFVAVVAATRHDSGLAGPAAGVGAALGLLPVDLAEDGMLGDTGANPLGAVIGLAVVANTGLVATAVVAGVLAALNLVAEWVSFTRVIDRTRWLHRIDCWGARHRTP
jgi:UDP-N-acetylmuramyl pentapeptide phosphotransferase/UDP-N-acetylglucosamine-1-phosphate transferase